MIGTCQCCGASSIDTDMYPTHGIEDAASHRICMWCAVALPATIVAIVCHGVHLRRRGRVEDTVSYTKTEGDEPYIFAGEWNPRNVMEYPPLADRRRELGLVSPVPAPARTPTAPAEDDDEKVNQARLMAFFFGREANVRANGTLAVSTSGRERWCATRSS